MKKQLFFTIVLIVLFISCKKDNSTPTPNVMTSAMGRDSLFNIMKDWYYWYNMPEAVSVTESNKDNYKDPYELLEAMRYRTLDKWSFVADLGEYTSIMEGTFMGQGIAIGLDNEGIARIVWIHDKSPLFTKGVRRGWIVKKIDNENVAPIIISYDPNAFLTLDGYNEEAITHVFLFQRPDGTDETVSATNIAFTANTVLLCDTMHLSSGITGHLVFETFYGNAPEEILKAFKYFYENDIKDLILDLRYNFGGSLNNAQILASFIAGNTLKNTAFITLKYNNSHPNYQETFYFNYVSYPISLSRLVVITSHITASASEALINGLKPFINMVIIGDTTEGKPIGMNMWSVGNKYLMAPCTFKMVNAQNQGDYFDGIPPAKIVSDDITHDFSDREELCLKEALYYLEKGSVSPKGVQEFKRYSLFPKKLEWVNNVFIESPLPQ